MTRQSFRIPPFGIRHSSLRKFSFLQMNLPRAKRRRLGIMRDHDDGFAGVLAERLQDA
jgi:hypothetical protein